MHKNLLRYLIFLFIIIAIYIYISSTCIFFLDQSFLWISIYNSAFLFLIFICLFIFYRYLKNFFIKPLNEILNADQLSSIDHDHIISITIPDKACDEIKSLIRFRNGLALSLKGRESRVLDIKTQLNKKEKNIKKMDTQIKEMVANIVTGLEYINMYNDIDTGEHMNRIALHTSLLGQLMGCEKAFLEEVVRHASLHDVGKVGIPDSILKKPGPLTPEEWKVMREHPCIGYEIVDHIGMNQIAKNIVLYHHEQWLGGGYPHGLCKEQIPLEARIVAIADVFDALVSRRVYKNAFDKDKVICIFEEGAGVHFDPALIKIFLNNIEKFYEIFRNYHTIYQD